MDDDLRGNGNVIEIIGGDDLIYDHVIQSPNFGNEPPVMETRNHQSMEMLFKTQSCIDQWGFVHNEQSRIRESHSIMLSTQSNGGYGGQVAASNGPMKPANWKTKICRKWEQGGFCQFGTRCTFAHGAAELQRYGGGSIHQNPNLNNQRLMFSNIVAPHGSSTAHAVAPSGSSVARAGGSGQNHLPGTVRKPWKGPDKINRIYGDWIDDL